MIGQLYAVERAAREEGASLERLAALREEHSRPLIDKIRNWAFAQTGLPRSDFVRAIRYMLGRWKGLTLFLDNPLIPLDNNDAENSLRGPVIGRKNYRQFRSHKGSEVGAILFSLCESARLKGVPPHLYLHLAAERAIQQPGTVTLPTDL